MKRIFLSILTVASVVFSISADNVANKTLSVQGKARIITPISLTNQQELDFGVIARGTVDATIQVNHIESPVAEVLTGDAVVITSTPSKAAKFTVTGESGKSYKITLPASATITSGANPPLNITNFTCSKPLTTTIGSDNVFYVGATLSVPATAVPASYTGSFNVTVAYE